MTLRHLKIFVAICRTGGVTAAAGELYMTQPAVSLALKELEEHYGLRLFDRLGHRLQITADGRRLLDYALPLTQAFDEMERAMQNPDGAGELRIGSSLTIGACLLPGYMQQLARCCPQVKQTVRVDNSDAIERAVARGELDIGLVESSVRDTSLQVLPFMEDHLIPVCPPGHPFAGQAQVSLDAFLAQPLLLREHGSGAREMFESALRLAGRQAEPLMESVSNTALLRAVEAGSGIAVLTERLVQEAVAAGRVCPVRLGGLNLSRSFALIYHRKKYLSPTLRRLIGIVTGKEV